MKKCKADVPIICWIIKMMKQNIYMHTHGIFDRPATDAKEKCLDILGQVVGAFFLLDVLTLNRQVQLRRQPFKHVLFHVCSIAVNYLFTACRVSSRRSYAIITCKIKSLMELH